MTSGSRHPCQIAASEAAAFFNLSRRIHEGIIQGPAALRQRRDALEAFVVRAVPTSMAAILISTPFPQQAVELDAKSGKRC